MLEELPADKAHHILGLEGAIWTEGFDRPARADYQVYPRLGALANVAWLPREGRNWPAFKANIANYCQRLGRMGVTGLRDYMKWHNQPEPR